MLVIGTGRIGSIVRDYLQTMCNVVTFDVTENEMGDLQPLIQQADCVTLHIPLTPETESFIDDEKLGWMKDGAALVNTSRGPIVDEGRSTTNFQKGASLLLWMSFGRSRTTGKITELDSSAVRLSPPSPAPVDSSLSRLRMTFAPS